MAERITKKASTALLIFLMFFWPMLFAIDITAMSLWWVARLPQPKPWRPRYMR